MMRHFFVAVLTGLEPATIPQTTGYPTIGRQDLFCREDRTRTCGLMVPNHPIYQLIYFPRFLV